MSIDNITGLKKQVPGGKYALTRAIAARAQQLQNGALPVTEVKTPNPISVAIEEVLQGKISFEIREGLEPTGDQSTEDQSAADALSALSSDEDAAATEAVA